MTGQQLYLIYAVSEEIVGEGRPTPWEQLRPWQRNVWEHLAKKLAEVAS